LLVQVNLLQVPINIGLDGLYLTKQSNEACSEAKGEAALKVLVSSKMEKGTESHIQHRSWIRKPR